MSQVVFSILISVFFLSSFNITGQERSAIDKDKISIIDSLLQNSFEKRLFNGTITIFFNDDVLFNKAYGFKDGSQALLLQPQSIFSIGSIAKEFKKVALMQLMESGHLGLDDPLSKFFPEFPSWSDSVTINHLLDYAGGLPQLDFRNVKNEDDLIRNLVQTKHLEAVPGTQYSYNHNTPILINQIIERVSGLDFKKYITSNIFKPLKLSRTFLDPETNHPLLALSYNDLLENDTPYNPFSGWIYSSSVDLNQWQIAVHEQKIISNKSYQRLIVNETFDGRNTSLGACNKEDEKIICYHWGGYFNYISLAYSNPELGLYISLLSNNGNRNLLDLARQIEGILQ